MNTRGLTDTIGIIDAPIAMNLPIYKCSTIWTIVLLVVVLQQ